MEPDMTTGPMAAKLIPLLFNMMGPIGVIPVFAALTAQMDDETRRSVARRATFLAFCALALAVFLGAAMLKAWGISNGSLILAAGVIVTLTALLSLVSPQAGVAASSQGATPASPQQLAVTPLAFPALVTPRAVGVLIIFVAFFESAAERLVLLAVAVLILVLDYIGMRAARWFMASIGMTPLLVLGAVFGVLQVALGVQMMVEGWQLLALP
jgi:multiple antibiotic resistance protein